MKGHARKTVREAARVRMHLTDDRTDLMTRAAIARNKAAGTDRPDPTLPPAPVKPLRSPFEQRLPAIQTAFSRIAVGAELSSPSALTGSYAPKRDRAEAEPANVLGDVTDYLKFRPSEGRDPEDRHD